CVLTFILKKQMQNFIFYMSLTGITLSLFSISQCSETEALYGSFVSNNFTVIFRILILLGTAVTIFLSKDYVKSFGKSMGEFYFLILTASLGGMLLCGANDLIMVFIALETLSISSFALCGYTKADKLSNEAALKYLIFGSVSTGVMLYGFSFIYGITGQTNLKDISAFLINYDINSILIVAFLLISAGFGFKISMAPFHAWTPDTYQGAPIPVAAYLSVVSTTAGFAVLIRFMNLLFADIALFSIIIAVFAAITMTLGNLAALEQQNIKRLMAYSSIAHAGYILLGLAIMTADGITAIVFYLITYLFMNFGAWAAVETFVMVTGKDNIDDFNGLSYKHRYFTLGFALCLLSLAGIPITAGFFSKFYLFKAVALAGYGYMPLLIIALINTAIALFYYMRVIKALYVKPENEIQPINFIKASFPLKAVMALAVTGVIFLGIFAAPFIKMSEMANKVNHVNQVNLSMKL
ncbi:MAG: NADH-quinone oxidoreductase subunit NuoN, partial [Candidatus Aenigmarchaeota archaeon]|nr:NADH-quinone oxidoreductase subunit NuoN [Candidatus Aenigmarchaeota archaeon]